MTREEWLDYFETVNGRKPSVQEMADALKAGEFVNEAPAKAEDRTTTEPIKVEAEIVETSTSPLPTETAPVVTATAPSTVAFPEGQAAMANLAPKNQWIPKEKTHPSLSFVSSSPRLLMYRWLYDLPLCDR